MTLLAHFVGRKNKKILLITVGGICVRVDGIYLFLLFILPHALYVQGALMFS